LYRKQLLLLVTSRLALSAANDSSACGEKDWRMKKITVYDTQNPKFSTILTVVLTVLGSMPGDLLPLLLVSRFDILPLRLLNGLTGTHVLPSKSGRRA
jgi:hypothetical protein